MCGLTGFVRLEHGSLCEGDNRLIAGMADRILHRGPDDGGIWIDPAAGVALGHRRLSILDLTDAGAQPMVSHGQRYVIAYNGEIYNHAQMRRDLELRDDVAWRGHSDTEVLLESIARQGLEKTLDEIDGMFAFALWDRQNRELTLARDRFGEKPLYYGWVDGSLLFGSELKPFRAFPGFKGDVDRGALVELLRFGYVPSPLCIYSGLRKLPPGAWIRFCTHEKSVREAQPRIYWSAESAASSARSQAFRGSFDDAVDTLDVLLRESVGERMVADVPVGALLSGGIDSSTLVALMQAGRGDRVRTFSIGSHAAGYDEATYAREVANRLCTEHTELYVDAAAAQAIIPRLPHIYDEPFADSSQIPTVLVSQLARRSVTVALSGDAGDEVFGGYNRHFRGPILWRRLARLPRPVRAGLGRLLTAVPPSAIDRSVGLARPWVSRELAAGRAGDKLHKLAGVLSARDAGEFLRILESYWPAPDRVVLGSEEARHSVTDYGSNELAFAEQAMLADTQRYLPNDILVKVDRASMSVSLETRVPFLSRRVFDFAWSLPLEYKVTPTYGKRVLRELLYRYVPREMVDRPKQGFGIPISEWLRTDLRDWAESLIDPTRLGREGFLDPKVVYSCWLEHVSGHRNRDTRLWAILMFQGWLESNG